MPVQDDERERELVRLFNLDWDPGHQRGGVDATLTLQTAEVTCRFDIEVKSTTKETVATARDVGMDHIRRWRTMFFVIGFYSREARRPELLHSLCLTPIDMEPWIRSVEKKIQIDFRLAERASRRLTLDDLFEVCGQQESYSVQDAKQLHKQQWSAAQYQAAADVIVDGKRRLSAAKMLEILQLRAKYIAERGATLNNPHVPVTHLRPFLRTDSLVPTNQCASRIREIAAKFVREHPQHPSILRIASAKAA